MLKPNKSDIINILIVEDDPSQVYLLTEALEGLPHTQMHIDDGLEAYKFLLTTNNMPDIVLLDYHLPNMDGLSIMQNIRNKGINCNFIFLTADYSIETAVKSINAGALEFIPKDGRFVTNIPTLIEKAYNVIKGRRDTEKYELALKASETRFKLFLEATKDGIFEWNTSNKTSYSSDHNALILGYEPKEFPKSPLLFIRSIFETDRKILFEKIREHVINDSNLYEAEIRVKTKDGSLKWLRHRGIVFDKKNGLNKLHIIGTHTDISERKLAEENLRQSEEEKKIILDNSHNAFILIDTHGLIVSYNKVADHRAILLTGHGLQKNIPAHLALPTNEQSIFIQNFEKAVKGEPSFWENPYNLRGIISWYEYSMVAVMQSRDNIKYVCYTSTDISERHDAQKRTMNAVIEAEERERKRFSEDLHDELGPLLSTIKIYINTLNNENFENEEKLKLVNTTNELINQAIQTSKSIANNLSPAVIERFGLIVALENFCQNATQSNQFNIQFNANNVNTQLNSDIEINIYRVITELTNNSLKHSNGNNISITIENITNSKLQIVYTDNGTGFKFDKILNSNNKGHGLHNINTRLNSMNGKYFQLTDNNTFTLVIEINT